jgi:hypothetical protein
MAFDNIFDAMKATTFDTVAQTMGYDAVWYPNGKDEAGITARVLYNATNLTEQLDDRGVNFDRPRIEYMEKDWPGFKAETDAKRHPLVLVRGTYYYAMEVMGARRGENDKRVAYDGESYTVILQVADDI